MATRTNYISVCSGGGGLDLAVRRASGGAARCVLYVERDVQAAAVLAAAMARGELDEAPIWSDLHTFDARPWRGLVDGLVGGYPCQPFSLAGSRRGADDPRHLWPRIREHAATLAIQWALFENVAGHLSLGFCEVADDLRGMGLTVAAGLFQASEVGAPHRRTRLFILADRPSRGCGELRGAPGARPGLAHVSLEPVALTGCQPDARRASGPGQAGSERPSVEPAGPGAESPRVADAGDRLVPFAWWRAEGGDGPRPAGACAVADRDGEGLGSGGREGVYRAWAEGRFAPLERDVVADADGGRRGGRRLEEHRGQQGAPGREPDGHGPVRRLEHAAQPERPAHPGPAAGVADAGGAGPQGGELGVASRERDWPAAASGPTHELSRPYQAAGVADASGEGREGGEREAVQRARRWDEGGATPELRRPYRWPPAPGDTERWGHVLAVEPGLAPALEPGLRGVAHGATKRVDRLRILGNGVVPDQAEYAIRVLARELNEYVTEG